MNQERLKEIEVKVKLDNIRKVKADLKSLGVVWGKTKVLIDQYYRPKGKERATQRPGSFIVRIRKSEKSFFALKALTDRRGVWEEYETEVENPNDLEEILKKISLSLVVVFHKKRTSGKLGKLNLELDEIDELGDYLEVEVLGTDGEKTQEEIKSFFKQLGLPEENIERRGYPEIVMETQGVKFLGQK